MTPTLVESSLLVAARFTDTSGRTWEPGDRVPLHLRVVREAVREHPEWFLAEYGTEPVDPDWFAQLDSRYEGEYREARKRRGEQEAAREKALYAEFEAQNAPDSSQRELERLYEQQQAEDEKREKQRRERREREQLEAQIAAQPQLGGFHYDD